MLALIHFNALIPFKRDLKKAKGSVSGKRLPDMAVSLMNFLIRSSSRDVADLYFTPDLLRLNTSFHSSKISAFSCTTGEREAFTNCCFDRLFFHPPAHGRLGSSNKNIELA